MNFIIVHGAYGSPSDNWIPWLQEELERLRHNVFVPRFTTGQTLENWMDVIHSYDLFFDSYLVLIGHSLGATFILKKLELLGSPIRAAFLVAGAVGNINIKKFDDINKSFFEKGFDWDKIKKSAKRFYVYHSDNDPYVPLEHGERIAQGLGVKLILVKGAGHFNEKSGYTKFDLLLDDIKKELSLK